MQVGEEVSKQVVKGAGRLVEEVAGKLELAVVERRQLGAEEIADMLVVEEEQG
jgi:hypothetical protein